VKGISDLITQNGIVNVDFADVKTVMSNMGRALMGTGIAKGANRARLAAEMAVSSPLLDDISVDGATGVLINIVGGPDLKMREIQEAASLVQEQAHEDANIIFGASIDEGLGENVKVTVIATGFDVQERMAGLHEGARVSIAPQTVASMQLQAQHHAQAHSQARPAYSLPPHSQPQQQPRMSEQAPAYSNRRAPASHPPSQDRVAPASQRIPMREAPYSSEPPPRRASQYPAFETPEQVWDIPAFQRKNQ